MEFETHSILLQNAFSVLLLQFTALISKALKAYDSSHFEGLFSLTLLVSVIRLCLYSYESESFSGFSFDSFGQGIVYSICAGGGGGGIFHAPLSLIFKREKRGDYRD